MSSLAAARADNYYYPKDWDPSQGSLNKYHKSHPLGVRAKKIDQGILVIRFEMPFHVRCQGCKNMIGKGVRFNAEKKAVGKFHSTRIWEFSMRCHLCSNKIIVKTDPENTEYIMETGAYKILTTEDATDQPFMRTDEEKKKLAEDPFFRLENTVNDVKKANEQKPRLDELISIQERNKDDYEFNSKLRKKFRIEKKIIIEKEKEKAKPKNFGLPLDTPKQEDYERAKVVILNNGTMAKQKQKIERDRIKAESILKKDPVMEDLKKKINRLPHKTKNILKNELKLEHSIKREPWISSIHKPI